MSKSNIPELIVKTYSHSKNIGTDVLGDFDGLISIGLKRRIDDDYHGYWLAIPRDMVGDLIKKLQEINGNAKNNN